MKNQLRSLKIGLIIICTFVACEKDKKGNDQINTEHYELYSMAINQVSSKSKVVIVQETKTYNNFSPDNKTRNYFIGKYETFDTTLLSIHENINSETITFDKQFSPVSIDVNLISTVRLNEIFDNSESEEGWEALNSEYEGAYGYYKISRIAFNEDKTQAMFEINHFYGGLGANWRVAYLQKTEGTWEIVEILDTWIS